MPRPGWLQGILSMTNLSCRVQQQHTWLRSLPTSRAIEPQLWISLLPKSEAKMEEKQEKNFLMWSGWKTEAAATLSESSQAMSY